MSIPVREAMAIVNITPHGVFVLLYAAAVFSVGGLVKGVSGFGLPLTVVPLLVLAVPVQTAIGWTLIPLLISQIAQIIECHEHAAVLRVIWPLIISLSLTLAFSVQLLAAFDAEAIMVLIGVLIQVFVLTQLMRNPLRVPVKFRSAILVVSGCLSGSLGGMTGFYGFPATQTLIAMRFNPREFIFATSATFLLATIIMALGLDRLGFLGRDDVIVSTLCVLPTLAAMTAGRVIRNRMPLRLFRRGVLTVISVTGLAMIVRTLI